MQNIIYIFNSILNHSLGIVYMPLDGPAPPSDIALSLSYVYMPTVTCFQCKDSGVHEAAGRSAARAKACSGMRPDSQV